MGVKGVAPKFRPCGARTKKDGTPCKQPAMPNGRCRIHGGKTPTGYGLPQTTHSRYSTLLPQRLRSRYEASLRDPDLLSLTQEIGVVDARLADVLSRVDRGESDALWAALRKAWQEQEAARIKGDTDALRQALVTIGALISRGVAEAETWADVGRQLETRRKLVDTERRRLADMQQMITAQEALALLGYVQDVIRKHVTDRTTLAAIADEFTRLALQGARGGPPAE